MKILMIQKRFVFVAGIVLLVFDIFTDIIFMINQEYFGRTAPILHWRIANIETAILAFAIGIIAFRREYSIFWTGFWAGVWCRIISIPYNFPMLMLYRKTNFEETLSIFAWASLYTIGYSTLGASLVYLFRPLFRKLFFGKISAKPAGEVIKKPDEVKSSIKP